MSYELSDCEWSEPMFPNKPSGIPRVDDRRVLNGIFWALRPGAVVFVYAFFVEFPCCGLL